MTLVFVHQYPIGLFGMVFFVFILINKSLAYSTNSNRSRLFYVGHLPYTTVIVISIQHYDDDECVFKALS